MSKLLILCCGIFLILFKVTNSIKITEVVVPEVYILNRERPEPLLLDCIYNYEKNETGLVLKWSHDNVVIYQWIPGGKAYALAHFKNHLDINYVVSPEIDKAHRALSITRPTLAMSGLYTCHVATFEGGSERKSGHLLVVVPESDFQLHHSVDEHGFLNIKCTASGIAPKPKLKITLSEDLVLDVSDREKVNEDGLFDVIVHAKVHTETLTLPTSITCIIDIPDTGYSSTKTALYEILPPTTTGLPIGNVGANTSEWSRLEATSSTLSDKSSAQSKTVPIVLSTLLMVLSCWFKTMFV